MNGNETVNVEWVVTRSRGQGEGQWYTKTGCVEKVSYWSGVKKRANWTLRGVDYFDSFHLRKVSRKVKSSNIDCTHPRSTTYEFRLKRQRPRLSFRVSSRREIEKEKEKGKKRKVSSTWASTEEQPASARRRWHKE